MTSKNKLLRAVRDKINDYEQTVSALLAFSAFVVHDSKSQRSNSDFGFGRRMTTSPSNLKSPSNNIYPDLVAQKSKKYGIVAEAKKTLEQDQSNWTDHIEQLRKYDDDLEGWWTEDEKIKNSDVVMLIHQSRGRPFVRLIESKKNNDPDAVGPNTCVVEFNESPETAPYYFFRLEFGDVYDSELKKSLNDGISVPLEKVKISFSNIQYYDAKPPMSLLLTRLWTDVFPSRMDEGEYDEQIKSIKIKVNVSNVTDELQKAFGSKALSQDNRSGEFPSQRWIREAFDKLVSYKLASPGTANGDYTIFFKSFRNDVLNRFILYGLDKIDDEKTKPGPKQLSIFAE